MTRGKYGARAANRVANLDNEIITELRHQLAAARAEQEATAAELRDFRLGMNAEARRYGAELAGEEIAALRRKLLDTQRDWAADRESTADAVFEVFRKHRGELPVEGYLELAELFGATSKFGMYLTGGAGNRSQRRLNGSTARLIAEKLSQPGINAGNTTWGS